ncbi:hypothetical protein FDO65_14750 [Nakamurella flava]|uniref:Uncharacterized protein n=1 Tax=Nakamurella flava TaxID=2576308 RepID=A0A4U6QFB1_9ACTN|nr:hypothetical protein [Nakamurella flava]TKV58771.1 hypothetical protein FDO65_14750 [Nakamurella flava]
MTAAPDDKPEPQPHPDHETRGPVEEIEYLEAEAQVNPNFRLWITIGVVVLGLALLAVIIVTSL